MTLYTLRPLNLPLVLCGAFYALLCVFSLVTGLMYLTGRRQLNPVELSDKSVDNLKRTGRMERFARLMGLVTFVVGVVQGLCAWAILHANSLAGYALAVGFTLFSIASVCFKLRNKVSAFALSKLVAYVLILVVLLLPTTRALFLHA